MKTLPKGHAIEYENDPEADSGGFPAMERRRERRPASRIRVFFVGAEVGDARGYFGGVGYLVVWELRWDPALGTVHKFMLKPFLRFVSYFERPARDPRSHGPP